MLRCDFLPMHTPFARRLVALCALLLTACQTLHPSQLLSIQEPGNGQLRRLRLQAVQQFGLQAKLAVQYAGKGYTARLVWQHDQSHDVLDIFSPLGQRVVHIEGDVTHVALTDQQGKLHLSSDVEHLTEQLLGWRLPLQGLSQWVLGIPSATGPFQAHYFVSGEPEKIMQDGWQIDYAAYQPVALADTAPDVQSLPSNIRLQQADIRLKLVVIDWQIDLN